MTRCGRGGRARRREAPEAAPFARAAGPITLFDASDMAVRLPAEVRDYDPAAMLPHAVARTTSAFMQYAFAAAEEALRDSGLDMAAVAAEPERVGVVMGTAMDGVTTVARTQDAFQASRTGKVSPHFVPMVIGNVAAAQVAIAHGLRGPSLTPVSYTHLRAHET